MKTVYCDRCGAKIPCVPLYMNIAKQGIITPKIMVAVFESVTNTLNEVDLCDNCKTIVYDCIFNSKQGI